MATYGHRLAEPYGPEFKNFGLDGIIRCVFSGFEVRLVINAGRAGTAWSGGDIMWKTPELVATLNKWVYNGGAFIGVSEPSSVPGYGEYFRTARVLGPDEDTGARVCHGRRAFDVETLSVYEALLSASTEIAAKPERYLTYGTATATPAGYDTEIIFL